MEALDQASRLLEEALNCPTSQVTRVFSSESGQDKRQCLQIDDVGHSDKTMLEIVRDCQILEVAIGESALCFVCVLFSRYRPGEQLGSSCQCTPNKSRILRQFATTDTFPLGNGPEHLASMHDFCYVLLLTRRKPRYVSAATFAIVNG